MLIILWIMGAYLIYFKPRMFIIFIWRWCFYQLIYKPYATQIYVFEKNI